MKNSYRKLVGILMLCLSTYAVYADNQTPTVSPIYSEAALPFSVVIELAGFRLPVGVHSGVIGTYNGLWVLMAGSHIGLHGFGANPFPPEAQNKTIYVVNPATGLTSARNLTDEGSGLTQQQIDSLSVISPQYYQRGNTLYMTGGYGFDTATQTFTTKPVLTAINLEGIVKWVAEPGNKYNSVAANIRQIYHPMFQITGGMMAYQGGITRLIFGQNFSGVYDPNSSGDYSQQIRQFQIVDNGGGMIVNYGASIPAVPDPNYRRRDLNVMPAVFNQQNTLKYGFVAYSGVFTPGNNPGIWTVPVVINDNGIPRMDDPNLPSTFKQGMNNYVSASAAFYSKRLKSMYTVFFGGMSFGFFNNGVFQTDAEIPFINQVTTVQMDKDQRFIQYLMNSQYPTIISDDVNPGNVLLFGAGAFFVPKRLQQYPNEVINLDAIRRPTVIGHIVGGIQSTVANTSSDADSSASRYVFKVTLIPK